jgi:hypothetical protein
MSLIGNLLGAPQMRDAAMNQAHLDRAALAQDMIDRGTYPGVTTTATTSMIGQLTGKLMHGLFPDSVGQTIFDGRLVVTKVLNGYVVQYMNNPSKQPDVYVESDLEGVNNRIKTLMATFRLEQK